ncbi:fatty acid desaturase family protein [Halobacteriovorax sp. RT-1-4]|uniref:fatty acid desaturase family protein n=1 Tax=unclassified Halobacteriovorax TaxID=2639665 RepID=UPI00399B6A94
MRETTINRDDIQLMKEILKNHHALKKGRIWFDLLSNALIGWSAFFYTCFHFNIFTFILAIFFIYRGTILVHEVSHIAKKVKGYRTAFNILFGWPNAYPVYLGDAHLFHHGKKTYGTERDPEYKYISEFRFLTLTRPFLASVALPIIQVIRFGILPLTYIFLNTEQKKWVYQNISTLAFSMDYKRPIRNEKKDIARMVRNDLMCVLYKVAIGLLIFLEVLPVQTIWIWFSIVVISSTLNMYRALFNHLYTNESLVPMTWEEHLLDTVTIESGLSSFFIFVNGLNYHAIHHLFPELPYTNLAAAHKELMEKLPADHIYKSNTYSSIFHVLVTSLSIQRFDKEMIRP